MAAPADIDAYLASVPEAVRPALEEIRRRVAAAVPDAVETISYQLPAFRRGKVFFYFAAFQKHIGVYPPLRRDAALIAELAPYRGEKGNLSFPLSAPIPFELIERVAVALAAEWGTPLKAARRAPR